MNTKPWQSPESTATELKHNLEHDQKHGQKPGTAGAAQANDRADRRHNPENTVAARSTGMNAKPWQSPESTATELKHNLEHDQKHGQKRDQKPGAAGRSTSE